MSNNFINWLLIELLLLIHIQKFLFADWLRACQLLQNTVQKSEIKCRPNGYKSKNKMAADVGRFGESKNIFDSHKSLKQQVHKTKTWQLEVLRSKVER